MRQLPIQFHVEWPLSIRSEAGASRVPGSARPLPEAAASPSTPALAFAAWHSYASGGNLAGYLIITGTLHLADLASGGGCLRSARAFAVCSSTTRCSSAASFARLSRSSHCGTSAAL